MNWDDIRYFLAVAETQTVTGAAAKLGQGASTVTRHVEELERSINVTLFHRRQSGYILSEAGRDLLPLARRIASEAHYFQRHAPQFSTPSTPTVRLELPELLAAYVIVPGLAAFDAASAGVRLEIGNGVEPVGLSERPSDIIIRFSAPDAGGYTVRRVGTVDRGVYGSSDYLMACEADGRPMDLISGTDNLNYLPTTAWFKTATEGKSAWLRSASVRLQVDAVNAGLGIAALPRYVAKAHNLTEVQEFETPDTDSGIWLLRDMETQSLSHVDLVIDWLEKIHTQRGAGN